MCYNKEVSFVVALFGICSAIKEFRKNTDTDTLKGMLIIILVLMQINEFFLHVYNKPTTWMHQISAFMIPMTILSQVIILFAGLVSIPVFDKEVQIFLTTISSMFIVIFIYFTYTVFVPNLLKKGYKSILICREGCRLRWDAADKIFEKNYGLASLAALLYLIGVFMAVYGIFGWEMMIVLISLLGFAFLWSYTGDPKQYNMIGSMWCFSAIIVFSIVIIGN